MYETMKPKFNYGAHTSDASTGIGRETSRNVFLKSIFEISFRTPDNFHFSKINIDRFFLVNTGDVIDIEISISFL